MTEEKGSYIGHGGRPSEMIVKLLGQSLIERESLEG